MLYFTRLFRSSLRVFHGTWKGLQAASLKDFLELAQEETIAIEFYKAGSVDELTDRLLDLLRSPERLETMAMQNFSAALRMSMPEIIRQYIRSFDIQHRVKMLRAASRFRRVPRWMPLRPALRHRVGQRLATWHQSDFARYLDASAPQAFAKEELSGNGVGRPAAASTTTDHPVDDTLPEPALGHPRNGNGSNGAHSIPEQLRPALVDGLTGTPDAQDVVSGPLDPDA